MALLKSMFEKVIHNEPIRRVGYANVLKEISGKDIFKKITLNKNKSEKVEVKSYVLPCVSLSLLLRGSENYETRSTTEREIARYDMSDRCIGKGKEGGEAK